MKKRLSVFLIVLACVCVPAFSSTFDLGFSVGTSGPATDYTSPLRMDLGMVMGFTENFEMDIIDSVEVIPDPFMDHFLSFDFMWTLMGPRSFGDRRAGIALNSMLGFGFACSTDNPYNVFMPTHLSVVMDLAVAGTPMAGRRERIGRMSLMFNPWTCRFSFTTSLIIFDFYAVGSYRDYY